MTPGIGYVMDSIERVRVEVARIETELRGFYMTGPKADEFKELAERMVNLTKPRKGHLPEGVSAKEFRDAA